MPKVSFSAVDVARAQQQLRAAGSAEQLRQAQAVLLPLELGLSLAATARAIGRSVGWTRSLRSRFVGRVDRAPQLRGGRRHQNMTPAQERSLLAPFGERLARGAPGVAAELRGVLSAALGRPVPLSTVYALLHRHGWRRAQS